MINPADEQAFATISLGSAADVDKAVIAARNAFTTWSVSTREDRLAWLERLIAVYELRLSDMARAISSEMGAPMTMALSKNRRLQEWGTSMPAFSARAEEFRIRTPA